MPRCSGGKPPPRSAVHFSSVLPRWYKHAGIVRLLRHIKERQAEIAFLLVKPVGGSVLIPKMPYHHVGIAKHAAAAKNRRHDLLVNAVLPTNVGTITEELHACIRLRRAACRTELGDVCRVNVSGVRIF